MNKNNCPCNNCLMIPICKHKRWTKMMYDCQPILAYANRYKSASPIFYYTQVIYKILKPIEWATDENGRLIETPWKKNNESTL
jgi:hypothetical protein